MDDFPPDRVTGRPFSGGLACPEADAQSAGIHVIVVGAGASGVLSAAHVLRALPEARVTMIERRRVPGLGLAYSTPDPAHLLNTRAGNMAAFCDMPDHFLNWLADDLGGGPVDPQGFVSRATYGRYLASLLDRWKTEGATGRLHVVRAECIGLDELPGRVVAQLDNGAAVTGDVAVLATGHALPGPGESGLLTEPWTIAEPVDRGAAVLIIGSGLTMVDKALSLLEAGHYGPILALSRRGLLPQPHRPTGLVPLRFAQVPVHLTISGMMRWLRTRVRAHVAAGGDWRDVVDGVRAHAQAIWAAWPEAERKRFLRHAAGWWDVHRHRMAPASMARIDLAVGMGQLQILRGSFEAAEPGPEPGTIRVLYRPRGRRQSGAQNRAVCVAQVLDCRGIRRDPVQNASALVASLLAKGAARIDALRIGMDVMADCRLVDAAGNPSGRIFAVGPAARAAFWEITAIPDIREQAARLASQFTATRFHRCTVSIG